MAAKFIGLCFILMPILLSCYPSESHTNVALSAHQPVNSTHQHKFKKVLITLERTACLGRCPIYKLTIDETGKVLFEGKEFVSHIGKKEFFIGKNKVRELISAFDKAQFFSLRDNYEGGPTDAPSAITSITIDGRTKTISHYGASPDAPKELTELENKIDAIAAIPKLIN